MKIYNLIDEASNWVKWLNRTYEAKEGLGVVLIRLSPGGLLLSWSESSKNRFAAIWFWGTS